MPTWLEVSLFLGIAGTLGYLALGKVESKHSAGDRAELRESARWHERAQRIQQEIDEYEARWPELVKR